MPKVVVAMPAQGTVKSKTSLCLAEMCLHNADLISEVWTLDGTYLHRMREKLAEAAVESDATHLFFVDSDVLFPPDGLTRLLGQRKQIIAGTYNMKDPSKRVAAYKPLGVPDNDGGKLYEFSPPKGTFKVRAAPTGFMLIETATLRSLPRPWFDYSGTGLEFVGEDIYFCHKAQKHGYDVWLDPTIPVGHLGDWVF